MGVFLSCPAMMAARQSLFLIRQTLQQYFRTGQCKRIEAHGHS